MKTITRTNATGTRTWKVIRLEDAFESWADGDDEALLHYHEDAPKPALEGQSERLRHLVTIHWPHNPTRRPIARRFATVEAARVGWAEARAFLAGLGFERVG